MSVNLLNLFKDQLSGAAMKGISSMLGESESKTGSALGGVAASLLGSLASKSSTSSGAAGLLKDLLSSDHSVMDNITDLITGDNSSNFFDKGGELVTSLLGGKAGSVIDAITKSSGIGRGSSSKLLSLTAPLLMGFVGKYVKSKALDAVGLGKLLGGQKDYIKSAMPSSLFDTLGLSSIGGAATKAVSGTASKVTDTVSHATDGGGGGGFIKPLLIALALLAAGYFGFKSCSGNHDVEHGHEDKHGEVDDKKVDNAINELEDHSGHDHAEHADHGDKMEDHAEHGDDVTEIDTKGLDFEQGSWGWKISNFLSTGSGSKTFALDKLPFEGDEVSVEAKAQLDNLAKILKAYPALNAEVQGHTEKAKNAVGKTKKKGTSLLRAKWVILKLKARGVDGKQLTPKGYGDEQLKSGLGEDDKAQRRIMIKFTK